MEEEKKTIKITIPKVNPWLISTIILAVILVIFFFKGFGITGMAVLLTPDEAADKAINYINNNLIQTGTATLVSVEELSGMYKIITSYQGQEIPIYITKDGSYLFVSQPLDTSEEIPKYQEPTSEFDAPDREKPNVKFFVMSFCPYGNQAEEGLKPVFELLGDKVEWEPHYVIYSDYASGYPDYCLDEENKYCSMHGIQELNQDIRELCVWKYYPHSIWWQFVDEINNKCSSNNVDICWEPIAKNIGVDVEKIKTCQKDEAITLLEEEVRLNEEYSVRGSPMVFINGQQYSGDRSPEAYKQAICSGFITEPTECSETLSGGSATAGGQC